MHILGELSVFLPGRAILRSPSVWEAIRDSMGLSVDLRTGEHSAGRDGLSLAESVEQAMREASIQDATWFAVDERILFHDRKRAPDDLGVLRRVIQDQAVALGGEFSELTLVFEHREEDIEVLLEARVMPRFQEGEAALKIELGGRVSSLRRAQAESYEEARMRLYTMLAESRFLGVHVERFSAIVDRLASTLRRVLGDEARVVQKYPRVVVIRPSPHYLQTLAEISLRGTLMWVRPSPLVGPEAPPVIDPWDRYYQDLAYAWVDLIELDDQVFAPDPDHTVATKIKLLDTRGNDLDAGTSEVNLRERLYSAHVAAMHDFTEPDRRAPELKGYEKAQGA
jgi:hypothetical protein